MDQIIADATEPAIRQLRLDGDDGVGDLDARRADFLSALHFVLPRIAACAERRDAGEEFPDTECDLLRACGGFVAPFPAGLGGLGLGTDAAAARDTMELLRLIGGASLPLGRIYEGHLNAIRLVCRLGTGEQARRAAQDAAEGHLFATWNTDPAVNGLQITETGLAGAKILASAAGHATRALVTAGSPRRIMLVDLVPDTHADLSAWTAQGMRATATGRVDFDHITPDRFAFIGAPDAYLAQPDFSGGAWRASAVALGGLDALMRELRHGLHERNRHEDPHQLARLGTALIAQETACLWVARAAAFAEADVRDSDCVVAYVGLARIAVESACLDAMRLAQRSLGLSAFMRPAPVERICRDLATYLRQPAPDYTLTSAAAYFVRHDLPA